jgi:hypothetical protein
VLAATVVDDATLKDQALIEQLELSETQKHASKRP